MNNKFLKILTGFSAMAVAGVLSFVPANAVNAGTVSGVPNYSIDFYNENGENTNHEDGYITDYSVSSDMNFFNCDINFHDYDDYAYLNVWLVTQNVEEDFELTFTIPYNLPALTFERYFEEFSDEYSNGDCGILNTYSINGNTIIISGTSSSTDKFWGEPGYFDVVFSNIIYAPDAVDEEYFEEDPEGDKIRDLYNSIKTTADDIIKAAQGINHDGSENPQKVVFYNYNGAVNYRIIQALAKTQGVTLLYTFEYQGYVFTSAITSEMAAQIFIEGEDWYGPCYIAKHCPTVLVDVVK